jgi:hypothetical protein
MLLARKQVGFEGGVSRILTVTNAPSEQSALSAMLQSSHDGNLAAAFKIAHSRYRSHSAQIQGHVLFIAITQRLPTFQQCNVCSWNTNRSLSSFLQNKAVILNAVHCATRAYRQGSVMCLPPDTPSSLPPFRTIKRRCHAARPRHKFQHMHSMSKNNFLSDSSRASKPAG